MSHICQLHTLALYTSCNNTRARKWTEEMTSLKKNGNTGGVATVWKVADETKRPRVIYLTT